MIKFVFVNRIFGSPPHMGKHTVETLILCIISKLGLKNVTVYSKHLSLSFNQVEHIFDKNLKYVL
jgi:hypothetical protein